MSEPTMASSMVSQRRMRGTYGEDVVPSARLSLVSVLDSPVCSWHLYAWKPANYICKLALPVGFMVPWWFHM